MVSGLSLTPYRDGVRNAILQSRDGRRFLVAQLMDSLGGGLSTVVLPWLVLDAGGSGAEAGAAFLVTTVPYVLLGLPAGEIGDTRPRRRVMEAGLAVQLASALLIPVTVLAGVGPASLPLVLIFAGGLGVTAGRVFVDAAAFGAIQRLVGEHHFVEGQAALSLVWSLGFLIGPALGGVLIGVAGAHNALWVQAAGFAVALLLVVSLRTDLGPQAREHRDAGGLASGLLLVARHRWLRMLTAVGMAWNMAINMIYALLVVFARGELGASGPQTGWMLGVGGAAGLVGGYTTPALHRRLGSSALMRAALVGSATGAIGLALSRSVAAGTVSFAVLEASGLCFITMLIGERQTQAAPHQQARVGITGRMAALLAATVGAVIGSALVARMSPSSVFAISAAATAAVALAGQWLLRRV
jgi:MFS family permease